MTRTPGATTTSGTTRDGRFVAVLLLGVFATIAAGIGLACFGMAGLIWKDGQLWGSSSWDDEADLAIGAGLFFLACWAVQLLVAITILIIEACRVQNPDRRSFYVTAITMPLISVLVILVAAPFVMGQGGAQLIPLGEMG